MNKTTLALALVGVLALTGIVAYYTDSQKAIQIDVASEQSAKQTETHVDQSQADQTIGRSAYLDPTTGKLVSEPTQSSQVIQPASVAVGSNNLPPVKITTHSNGMVQADLNGRFQASLHATIGCDGKITMEHSNREISEATNCEAEK